MEPIEETIQATLDSNGQLRLMQPPRHPPGPVWVTIRGTKPTPPKRSLADVIREIAVDQRARGFVGRTDEEIQAELAMSEVEESERDRELDAARQ